MRLDEVRERAGVFPTWVAEDASTAACFFSAAFMGVNAEVHLTTAGSVLCVDTDQERLDEMRALYPPTYHFIRSDAFRALDSLQGQHFDVVTADPFTNLMRPCLDRLSDFRAISGKLVLGITPEMADEALARGAVEVMPRSIKAAWAVWT